MDGIRRPHLIGCTRSLDVVLGHGHEQLQQWSVRITDRFGYAVRFLPVGEEDAQVGRPNSDGGVQLAKITIPELSLVLLAHASDFGNPGVSLRN